MFAEAYSHWKTSSGAVVRELKHPFDHILFAKKIPKRLWPYLIEYCSGDFNFTTLDTPQLYVSTPEKILFGGMSDISWYLNLYIYDPIGYTCKPAGDNPTWINYDYSQIRHWIGIYKSAIKANS